MAIDENLYRERNHFVDDKLATHERRLNNHSERLDRIEQNSSRLEERLDNLIKQLAALNSTMRWFIGLMVGSFVAFFFYAVQKGLFK